MLSKLVSLELSLLTPVLRLVLSDTGYIMRDRSAELRAMSTAGSESLPGFLATSFLLCFWSLFSLLDVRAALGLCMQRLDIMLGIQLVVLIELKWYVKNKGKKRRFPGIDLLIY